MQTKNRDIPEVYHTFLGYDPNPYGNPPFQLVVDQQYVELSQIVPVAHRDRTIFFPCPFQPKKKKSKNENLQKIPVKMGHVKNHVCSLGRWIKKNAEKIRKTCFEWDSKHSKWV